MRISNKDVQMQAMKAYGRVEVEFHSFLTSALYGGECSAACPNPFILGKIVPGTGAG
jgi:hypothetical protein